jgi:hypothetical protein
MTLIEQFPDISMLIREKKKLNLKYSAVRLFKDIKYKPIGLDQDFYDKEFRNWHYRLILGLGITFTAVFFLALNMRSILNWIAS